MAEHFPGQPLGARHVVNAAIEHRFHFRIAPGHGIADQHQIWSGLEILDPIALHQLDALSLKLGTHGRVNTLIGAGHGMAKLSGDNRQATHKGAADAQNVYVH